MACPDCFTGTINDGTPSGIVTTIHGLPTYVARPEGPPKGLIVIIPDAFGWDLSNGRVLADKYARKGGYLVYLPDFMNGHGVPGAILATMDAIFAPSSWLTTIFYKPLYLLRAMATFVPFFIHTRRAIVKPRIFSFFTSLRTNPLPESSNLKIGVAAFCWGGQYAILLAHNTPSSRIQSPEGRLEPLIDCAYTAHPSFVQVPKDIEAVTVPLSVAVGDVDMAMKYDLVKNMKEILEKKKAGDHEVVVYPGAKHGFAVRGDPGDEEQVRLGEKAEKQALGWFGTWLGGA